MERKIDLCIEPMAFFQERVDKAMRRQRLKTLEVAQYYIVDLLSRYISSVDITSQDPLAILLLKSQKKDIEAGERFKLLRNLGDTALYVSGFFGDSFNRKVIDIDYYREMGAIAYRSLSASFKENSFQQLYNELHAKFPQFVDVLAEVSQSASVQNNQNLLRLYELYVNTGNELAKRRLEEKGLATNNIIPLNSNRKTKN